MNSETQRDSSVILRLTRDLPPENLRPLQVGEVQNITNELIEEGILGVRDDSY